MKNNFTNVAYIACALSILIIAYEFVDTFLFYRTLNKGETDFYSKYRIQTLINKENGFIESQLEASFHKISRLERELYAWVILTLTLVGFTNQKAKNTLLKGCSRKMNILNANSVRTEINYVSIFICAVMYAAYGNGFVKILLGKEFDTILSEILFYICMFCVVLPFLLSLIYNLFRIFGNKLIIAYYLTFYIKATAEFFTQEPIDLDEFKKVDITQYSHKVREYLHERHLENDVYQEKDKAESINAALVGWGKHEHIEIYGNHGKFSNDEFESVLMHEIGHSQDYSLHKKVIMLYFIKSLEFALVLWLFNTGCKYYVDEDPEANGVNNTANQGNLSKLGVFIILVVIYEMTMNRYLMILHKLTSQNAEINADLIAKKHGFGPDLARVLFKITVGAKESIHFTFPYNALKSYHPTILRRAQYLLKKK